MKYLKTFNESIHIDIRDFCESYLEGKIKFDLTEDHLSLYTGYIINWDDIKIFIISFLRKFIKDCKINVRPYKSSDNKTHLNRTIRLKIDNDYYYMALHNLIKDKGVPNQFYKLEIIF